MHKKTTLEVRAKVLNSYYAVFYYAVFLIVCRIWEFSQILKYFSCKITTYGHRFFFQGVISFCVFWSSDWIYIDRNPLFQPLNRVWLFKMWYCRGCSPPCGGPTDAGTVLGAAARPAESPPQKGERAVWVVTLKKKMSIIQNQTQF